MKTMIVLSLLLACSLHGSPGKEVIPQPDDSPRLPRRQYNVSRFDKLSHDHQEFEFTKEFYDDRRGGTIVHFMVDLENASMPKTIAYFMAEGGITALVVADRHMQKILEDHDKPRPLWWLLKKALKVATHAAGPLSEVLALL